MRNKAKTIQLAKGQIWEQSTDKDHADVVFLTDVSKRDKWDPSNRVVIAICVHHETGTWLADNWRLDDASHVLNERYTLHDTSISKVKCLAKIFKPTLL